MPETMLKTFLNKIGTKTVVQAHAYENVIQAF